jgi:hypothetical protein
LSAATPDVAAMDIRFTLQAENGEPLVCVAKSSVAAKIAHELVGALGALNAALEPQGTNRTMPDPLSDQQAIAGWKRNAIQMSIVLLGMQDFAEEIVRHVSRGGVLTESEFAKLMKIAAHNVKNFDVTGLPMEQQSKVFGDAMKNLEGMMNRLVTRGRKPRRTRL